MSVEPAITFPINGIEDADPPVRHCRNRASGLGSRASSSGMLNHDVRAFGAADILSLALQGAIGEIDPGSACIDHDSGLDFKPLAGNLICQNNPYLHSSPRRDIIQRVNVRTLPLRVQNEFQAEPFGIADARIVIGCRADDPLVELRPHGQRSLARLEADASGSGFWRPANWSYKDNPILKGKAPRSWGDTLKPRNFPKAGSRPAVQLKIGMVVGRGRT